MIKWICFLCLFCLSMVAFGDAGPSPLPVVEPAHIVSLWDFVKSHWKDIAGPVFTLLFFLSEYMALNPNMKSNGIFDFVRNWLKKRAGVA